MKNQEKKRERRKKTETNKKVEKDNKMGTRNDLWKVLESLSWYKTVVHFLCQNGRRRQEQLQKGLYDHNWRECRVTSGLF